MPRRHLRGRDGGVLGHVDGEAEDLAAALEPDEAFQSPWTGIGSVVR